MAQRTWYCNWDVNDRWKYDPRYASGGYNGADRHLRIGLYYAENFIYRAYLNFAFDWTGIARINKATLHLRTGPPAHGALGTEGKFFVRRLTQAIGAEPSDGENLWTSPRQGLTWGNPSVVVNPPLQGNKDFTVDVTKHVSKWAPNIVETPDGPGPGLSAYGLILMAYTETKNAYSTEIYSRTATNNIAYRPKIVIDYDPIPTPGKPTGMSPSGTLSVLPDDFTGAFNGGLPADRLTTTHIQVFPLGEASAIWNKQRIATDSEQQSSQFSVPLPEFLRSGTTYEWRARVQDQRGTWSPYSSKIQFKQADSPPSVALQPAALGSVASLSGVHFRGVFSDPDPKDRLGSLRIQLRPTTPPGDPDWDSDTNLWDTGDTPPRREEVYPRSSAGFNQLGVLPWQGNPLGFVDRLYGGQALTAGSYSWRMRVSDRWNAHSDWEYGTLTLTQDWAPSQLDIEFLAENADRKPKTRVLIRGMDGNRGPADPPLAIIENAANVGASQYFNAGGEFYMTLPANHAQVSVIEPWQVHYAVEVWRADRWEEKFAGLITDFNATQDDVIFYGEDYLALFNRMVDDRYIEGAPDKSYTDGGSKYVETTINDVFVDQFNEAIGKTDSLVGFISIGAHDTFSEEVTIYSTFTPYLDFVVGLLQSHQQGTGVRSRIWVQKKADLSGYEIVWQHDPGIDRDKMRLEYGSLIQAFELVGFGEFASKVHGIGKARIGTELMYKSASAPGIDTAIYGRSEKVNVWDDVEDKNDLQRRVKQAAGRAGKVGKRIALGIRVDGILPFDGYDITDNVRVVIQRGVVDTTRYGSGYWSVLGTEWVVYPDGQTETTLVILPKEDAVPPDPDLIPSDPILAGREWEVGYEPPVQGVNTGKLYLDLTTGITYVLQADGSYVIAGQPDVVPPPQGLSIYTANVIGSNGEPVVKLTVTVNDPASTSIRGTWVEVTYENDGQQPPGPLWNENGGHSYLLFIPQGETSASVEGVPGGLLYYARAWAVDFVGTFSGRSASADVTTTAVKDESAPAVPQQVQITGSVNALAVGWLPSAAGDLQFYEVRYAVDDGTGTGVGGSPVWTTLRARTSFIYIGSLLSEQQYWLQVRAVDSSGNVEDAGPPVMAVDYIDNPDTGWTDLVTGTTTLIEAELLDLGIISDEHISAAGLSAEVIHAGLLRVNTSDADMIDGIEIWDAGVLVGLWNETGLYIYDSADASNYVRLYEAGITVFANGVPSTAITPAGINASAITFGTVPGGHNILYNSSFELADYNTPANEDITWSVAADWTSSAYIESNIDATYTGDKVYATGVSF